MIRIVTATLGVIALGAVSSAPAAAQKGDRTRLMPEEIATKPEIKNVYDAIKTFRPAFFRVRARGDNADNTSTSGYGASSGRPEPSLFIDETRFERLDDLRNIPVGELTEVKLLSESETNVRFGPGHPYGALMVTTNRRR